MGPLENAARSDAADGAGQLLGTVKEVSYHGDVFKLAIAVGGDTLAVKVARRQGGDFEVGRPVVLTWSANAARLLPAASDGAATANVS